jgi:hypothetical protein
MKSLNKPLKISEATHQALTKVKGQLMAGSGNSELTYDDVIQALIELWNKRAKP